MMEGNYISEYSLEQDAFVGLHSYFFETKLSKLADMAKDEQWNFKSEKYKDPSGQRNFPILNNYLYFTYDRLKAESKIAILDDESAMCFNTGLQTKEYERDIYAYFTKNIRYPATTSKQWNFVKFCKSIDNEMTSFSKLPDIAEYWDNPSDLIFDKRLDIRFNDEHIVEHNISRFQDVGLDGSPSDLLSWLEQSTKRAEKRVRRNYKIAIPQFFTDKDTNKSKIQLLLPLCPPNSTKALLALVITKAGETYLAKTVLPLDMAYMNSRRIVTPDADWIVNI
ncbi:uncharacterized protein DUF3825 [Anaerobacterium chartisolvens]|uniref:Uncharacterized protein DUF3825 n=1 Tax=Anaerobacterium chartisolvens TaxID=1297424 RepID=A0A369B4M6_9FIRM|nr:DUF3825 domain-containing protein [Anaerobacterium chartisolvens]RCX16391.1 uncharacterized protein DUF3825 [Anaerobacterium chartisolvens]